MRGLPTDPTERIADVGASAAPAPRDLLPGERPIVAPAADLIPAFARAEGFVEQLSRWAGPTILAAVVLTLGYWMLG